MTALEDVSADRRLIVRYPGLCPYEETLHKMQDFTERRTADTADEIWLLQHPAVFTLGLAGDETHLLDKHSGIPVVKVDRGGQITYHGPGQVIMYLMLDLTRRQLKVRELVTIMEQAIIDCLACYNVSAQRRAGAPGVYTEGRKIASLGLRIRRGCSYHGLALNVDMDLTPFHAINPCGYAGLEMTQLAHFRHDVPVDEVMQRLLQAMQRLLRAHGDTQKRQKNDNSNN